MKVCHKTCIFFFFPIINKYLCMAKRSLLSRCPSYKHKPENQVTVSLDASDVSKDYSVSVGSNVVIRVAAQQDSVLCEGVGDEDKERTE